MREICQDSAKICQDSVWIVRAFYANNVPHPKVPGALAFETRHETEADMKRESDTARGRDDIGEVYCGQILAESDA